MLNCVALTGRLVADPVNRVTTTGKSVCTFKIAVDRSFTKPGEERKADFITIVAWESTANFVVKHFSKGSMIGIVGAIQTRSYEDSSGKKRTAFEVLAKEVSFCGSKSEGNNTKTQNDEFDEIDVDEEDLPF